MPRPRTILLVTLPLLLHGLAREVDGALGLVLRAEVEPAGLLAEVARAMGAAGPAGAGRILAWVVVGLGAWVGLAGWRARQDRTPLAEALPREVPTFIPLLLRPALSVLALLSVGLQPSYPWAFTLPVALTQDLGVAQDVAAVAALAAVRLPPIRIPAPGPRAVLLLSFLVYALLTPEWARHWDGHPGNEPKYLRMAVALGHHLTLDAEGVSAAMEELPTTPLGEALVSSGGSLARESWRMAEAIVRGEAGRDAIRATRITRQTIRGKEGGVFYVLAPGPSFVLAPTFRIDRALNRSRGTSGPLVVSVLAWNAIAALLVVSVFLLIRDATGRPGLAATLAWGFALLPPFLFYFFQFYPEMPGALVLAVAFHVLALKPDRLGRHPWLFGMLLATLPWLHQKFLPVWLVLIATALWVMWRERGAVPRSEPAAAGPGQRTTRTGPSRPQAREGPAERGVEPPSFNEMSVTRGGRFERVRALLPVEEADARTSVPANGPRKRLRTVAPGLVALLVPQVVSLYLTALYNFTITGSVRPDALFLAWGPGGVTTARVGQGLLGILLDARYGILPYVPLLTLAVAGLVMSGARRFAVILPAAAVYYLTVASADNWAGAVCNLGRYFMPLAPLAIALVAVAIARASTRRGAVALVLILAGWSALFALALWNDPHAANDSALLLAESTYADGNQYIPNLFFRRWSDGAPGLWARIALWFVAMAVAAIWWRRSASADPAWDRELEGIVRQLDDAVANVIRSVRALESRLNPQEQEDLRGSIERARSALDKARLGVRPLPAVTLAGTFVVLLAFAFTLEQWPAWRSAPSFGRAIAVGKAGLAFAEGAVLVREDEVIVGPGPATLLLRSPGPVSAIPLTVGGEGILRAEGLRPFVLRPTGARVDLPLRPYHVVHGTDDLRAVFAGTRLSVEGQAVLRPAAAGSPSERESQ